MLNTVEPQFVSDAVKYSGGAQSFDVLLKVRCSTQLRILSSLYHSVEVFYAKQNSSSLSMCVDFKCFFVTSFLFDYCYLMTKENI